MKKYSILIIDDEKSQRDVLSGYLKKKGYTIFIAISGEDGIKIAKENLIDIILSDFKMPDMTGIEVLEEVKKMNPEISFIMITAFGTVENAVRAMRLGADDYISKPVDLDELDILIDKIIGHKDLKSENEMLKTQLQEKYRISAVISESPNMASVINIAVRVAESKATVLITGESGTGKEVIAKSIHYLSSRKDKPFVAVNIPALSATLIESELFGHEKGSFTGADKMSKGRFELADKGTIFLDEIGDIPLATQVKLLRVLQEQQIERVGSAEGIYIDTRIITATNQNLDKKIKDGTFREDLFYRLNIVSINIPPLRERKEDIIPLIEFFIKKYSEENHKKDIEISKEALDRLLKYNYPGNVRELENIIERAVVLSRRNVVSVDDLPFGVKDLVEEERLDGLTSGTLSEQVEALEKKMIYNALKKTNGNQTQAGKLLGLTERNLRYKLNKYNIQN